MPLIRKPRAASLGLALLALLCVQSAALAHPPADLEKIIADNLASVVQVKVWLDAPASERTRSTPSQQQEGRDVGHIQALEDLLSNSSDARPTSNRIGSGIIVGPKGRILTSAHLLKDARRIRVRLYQEKRWLDATVVKQNKRADIAEIKVEATHLRAATLGSEQMAKAGEWVIAIGSPFGFEGTASVGIVSALRRDTRLGTSEHYIQTDVASNPGNSGGPLINMRGEVIGMLSQIYTQSGGDQGVSFAVPAEALVELLRLSADQGD